MRPPWVETRGRNPLVVAQWQADGALSSWAANGRVAQIEFALFSFGWQTDR